MVIYLNFAPTEYLGGAERKLYELFTYSKKYEKSVIANASPSIASLYGKVVLGVSFEDRSENKLKIKSDEKIIIDLMTLIPFSKKYFIFKNLLKEARIVYFKADLNELLILLYFGGFKILNKSVAGIRSAWLYPTPSGFWDHFHNFIFKSKVMKSLIIKMKLVHVLNKRDYEYFNNVLKIKQLVMIPNYSYKVSNNDSWVKNNSLRIIFVGELIKRKGIDTLIKIIESSPDYFFYNIVGKGPMVKNIKKLAKKDNIKYWGYLNAKRLSDLYLKNDVLLFPSRAEGFGGVILEAIAHGLFVVDSPQVYLGINNKIEYKPKNNSHDEYLVELEKINKLNKKALMNKKRISKYFRQNYSEEKIIPKLLKDVIGIKI